MWDCGRSVFNAIAPHTLGRMQLVESNLLAAKRKIVTIRADYADNSTNSPTQQIDDVFVDVRAEICEIRKTQGK